MAAGGGGAWRPGDVQRIVRASLHGRACIRPGAQTHFVADDRGMASRGRRRDREAMAIGVSDVGIKRTLETR